MATTGINAFGGGMGQGQTGGGKEKIGQAAGSETAPTGDDPSRSALHYGAEHRGKAQQTAETGADGAVAPLAWAADHPAAPSASLAGPDQHEPAGAMAPPPVSGQGPPPLQDATGAGPGTASLSHEGLQLGDASPAPVPPPATVEALPDGPAPSGLNFEDAADRPDPQAPAGAPAAPGPAVAADETGAAETEAAPHDVTEASGAVETPPERAGADMAERMGAEPPAAETAPSSPDVPTVEPNAAPTDITLSNGAIAAGTEGAAIGSLHTVDADAADIHSYTVSDERFEVSGGILRLRDGQSLDSGTEGSLAIDVTATDPSGETVSRTFEIEVVEMPEISAQSGFHARYFDVDHKLQELDDIDWSAPPTHEELVGSIDYENGHGSFWEDGATDTFGAQITGHVEVETGGSFTFSLGGDDGAVLYVNGVEVIENDGLHSYHTRSGEIELEPGTHHIEVRYFENHGRAGLKLDWEGPGIDGQQLVTAPGIDDVQSVNGMPTALGLDTGPDGLPDQSSLAIQGLPEGTMVEAGDHQGTVGADGSLDITGWDMSLMTVTTPLGFVGPVAAEITTTMVTEAGNTAVSSEPLAFEVDPAMIEPAPVALVGGFEARYFDVDHALRKLDDVDWSAPPTHTEMVQEIHYQNGHGSFWEEGATDTFGAKLEGMITVEKGGSYDFYLGGDDGVVLMVDGVELIDNDGEHGYRTRSGEIDLDPGTHHIEVRYFENYGRAGLKLEWDGPDTDGRELVQADAGLSVPENGTLMVGLEHDTVSDAATIQVHGLPAHTILMNGDATAVSDGGPVDISGWDTGSFEIAPPPGYEGEIAGQIVLQDTAFNGETVTSVDDFSISVGDADETRPATGAEDDLMVLHAAETAEGSEAAQGAEGSEGGISDDDILEQPVAQRSDDEQSFQITESYERYDW